MNSFSYHQQVLEADADQAAAVLEVVLAAAVSEVVPEEDVPPLPVSPLRPATHTKPYPNIFNQNLPSFLRDLQMRIFPAF